MNVSWNWLRELVKLDEGISPQDAARRLSGAGVAVDAVRSVGAGLSGVIVAEIRGRRPHPKADKLTLVDVFDGREVTQVVCGAPNVPAPGEPGRSPRVAWARPGARLPSGLELGVREVRGIPSPGMLCAEDELGLSTDHGGIIILRPEDGLEIGSDFATGAGIPDHVFELDITPNRPDLLGHVGVARELAALYADQGARLTLPIPDLDPYIVDKSVPANLVTIEDPAGCPRYMGHVAVDLKVRPSPLKVRLLLARLGSRSINNLVDATNLALFCFGQPLHAFDLQRLSGQRVVVRRARPEETLKTLDGTVRTLAATDLVIADAERPVAVAGVMGGADSEVTDATTAVLLESAYFDPGSIRRTSKRLKLHTEASHRFERGVDPNSALDRAARYCLELVLKLGEGRLLRGCVDAYPTTLHPKVIALRPARTNQILGRDVPAPQQAEKLTAIGLAVEAQDASSFHVVVPTFRPDITREIDLIEEVGRLVGYDAVVGRVPHLRMAPPQAPDRATFRRLNAERVRDLCAALGLDEVQLFSMTGPERLQKVQAGSRLAERFPPLPLENPLREELSVLRTQLLPGLLEALRQNLHGLGHGRSDVSLFEVGEVFYPRPAGQPEERTRVGGVLAGHRPYFLNPGPTDALDFFDVRGLVEELLAGSGYALGWSKETAAAGDPLAVYIRAAADGEAPWLHPGAGAVVVAAASDEVIGDFGELHPTLRDRLGIESRAFSFELDVPVLPRGERRYQPPSRFPTVSRDLSFFIARDLPAATVCATLLAAREPLLVDVAILEDYRETGKVAADKKGLLLGLTYRADDRTLTDDEVQKAHDRLVAHLQSRHPIELR